MNYKLGFILLICTTFSNADAIHIPSTATPEGITLEQYNELPASLEQTDGGQKDFNTIKANTSPKAKTEVAAKANADAPAYAKRKAEAAAKAKADAAAAKRKAEAYAKAKAETDVKPKANLEPQQEAEESSARQTIKEAAAEKRAEAKKITSSAKRDFDNKIKKAWIVPENTLGQKATVRVTLTDSGAVASVVVNAADPDVKESIEKAVHSAAPYPMPSDPDARSQARSFTASFTVK